MQLELFLISVTRLLILQILMAKNVSILVLQRNFQPMKSGGNLEDARIMLTIKDTKTTNSINKFAV